ncbi:hypothetical protein [Cardiobacterium sp. Marseille-Q4385]|uniref:hypothetical protein n=1 Tax=Cardiobacterium sp. Marseille-Q4385 TaxID=2866573 RepID=UPI001CE3EB62|nr:hypothetical protein [Cardiobacterium sp. Marseille-Q4385]
MVVPDGSEAAIVALRLGGGLQGKKFTSNIHSCISQTGKEVNHGSKEKIIRRVVAWLYFWLFIFYSLQYLMELPLSKIASKIWTGME